MPGLTEMAKKYAGKATFTGVNVWEEQNPTDDSYFAKVEKFVAEQGDRMGYNVALDGHEGVMANSWMRAAGQNGIPASFVIDQQGKIVWIGHPMGGLDEVVGKVIAGTFDAKAEADRLAKMRAYQAAQRTVMDAYLKPLRANKFPEAVAAIDKLIADKKLTEAQIGMTRYMALARYDAKAANAYAAKLAGGVYKGDSMSLNGLAWTMVDEKAPLPGVDVKLAVKIAEASVAATKAGDEMAAYNLDTLAFCYFKDGQVAKAIATQEKALKLADSTKGFDASTRAEIAGRLDRFKAAKGP